MPVPDTGRNKCCLASCMTYRNKMIWLCSIAGANSTTCYLVSGVAMLLFLTFIGDMLCLVGLYLKLPLIVTMLRFVVRTIRSKWQQFKRENPLISFGVFIITTPVACAHIPVKTNTGAVPIYRAIWCARAKYAILNVRGIQTLGHPDTFFKQNPVDPTNPVRKNREAFFEVKCFKVDEACGVDGSIPVLICSKVVGALIKKNFFIDLRQQEARRCFIA